MVLNSKSRLGVLVLVVMSCAVVCAQPAPAATVGAGHVDLVAPRWINGGLTIEAKDDSSGATVWRPPSDIVVQVGPSSRVLVPDDSAYGFLGAPGSTAWVLPQNAVGGLPWIGWSTQGLPGGVLDGDRIQMSLLGASGPGAVFVYRGGAVGAPSMVFAGGGSITVGVGTHAHANWAFTAPGTYALTFRVSGTSGGIPTAATGAYVFQVLGSPLPPPPVVPPAGGDPATPAAPGASDAGPTVSGGDPDPSGSNSGDGDGSGGNGAAGGPSSSRPRTDSTDDARDRRAASVATDPDGGDAPTAWRFALAVAAVGVVGGAGVGAWHRRRHLRK